MNREPSNYEAGVPTNQLQRSITPGSKILLEKLIDAHIFFRDSPIYFESEGLSLTQCPTFDIVGVR
jgi:hypothetical protein